MSGAPSFRTFKVIDPCIGDISADTDYGVLSGPAQKTYVASTANSRGNSTISFVANVPSQNTLVDRQILLEVPMQFRVKYRVPTAGLPCEFSYGYNDSLQCFPMAQIMTSLQATINNTTVANEVNYSLPALLKVNNVDELMRYNSMSPSLPDQAYALYADGKDATNSPLGSFVNSGYNVNLNGRGSYPAKIERLKTDAAGVAYGGADQTSDVAIADGDLFIYTVRVTVTEPIFCSPFIWSGLHDEQSAAFLGINTISLNINVDSQYRRLWSSASSVYNAASNPTGQYVGIEAGTAADSNFFGGAAYDSVTQKSAFPSLLLNFMTSQPSQVLDVRNVIPYMSMDSKVTSKSGAVPAFPADGSVPITVPISSSTFTLNQVPDQVLVYAQKKWSSKNPTDSSSFLSIKQVNINFNNQAGLLSSAAPEDLWRMSSKNACNQNWLEWVGCANATTSNGVGKVIGTTGSMLVVSPALDLSLPDFLSAGSLGQFQFQIDVQVMNQGKAIAEGDLELVCLFVNSGILQTEAGMSSLYTGLLDKSLVLETKDQSEGIKYSNRVIGGMAVRRRHLVRKMGEKMAAAAKAGKSKLESLF
jgi:hypothetical protein